MSLAFYGKTVFSEVVRLVGASRCFTKTAAVMTSNTKYTDYVKFLELAGNLKHLKRTGWVMRDVKDCESIAGHMYRMSLITFLLDENQSLDRVKCMEMALVHDLAEAVVGDITPYCGVSKEEKRNREFVAMEDIAKLAGPSYHRLMELFHEYEQGESAEAKFVKDLDRLDMVMQAFEYEKKESNLRLQEFFDNTDGKFQHPFVQRIVKEIYAQRKEYAAKLDARNGEKENRSS